MSGPEDDVLNKVHYQPPMYEAPARLLVAHDSMALRSTNQFVLPIGDVETWRPYYIGIFGVPIAICVVVLLSICTLCWDSMIRCCTNYCCRRCANDENGCCKGCCSCAKRKNVRIGGFVFFCACNLASISMWAWSLSVNELLSQGFSSFDEAATKLVDTIREGGEKLVAFGQAVGETTELLQSGNRTLCGADVLNQIDEIDQFYSQLGNASKHVVEVGDTFLSVANFFGDMQGNLETVDTAQQVVLNIWSSVMIALSVLYLVSVCIAFWSEENGRCSCFVSFIRGSACLLIYSVGILTLTLAIIISMIMYPLGTAGADACAPGISSSLQNLLAQTYENKPLQGNVGLESCYPIDDNIFGYQSPPLEAQYILCYYQTCSAVGEANDLFVQPMNLASGATSKLSEAIPNLKSAAEQANATEADICKGLVTAIVKTGEASIGIFDFLITLISCEAINDFYRVMVEETLCDSFVHASLVAWQSYFFGALTLLLALLSYQIFQLGHGVNHQFGEKFVEAKGGLVETDSDASRNEGAPIHMSDHAGNTNNNNNNSLNLA